MNHAKEWTAAGLIAPAVTPFQNDLIDWDCFERDIAFLVSAGVDGIGVGGSTGEGAELSDHELHQLIERSKRVLNGSLPIVAGIIRNSTQKAVETALVAKDAGADALLITPVFYFGATDDGNHRYYESIGEAVRLPIIVYNVVPTNPISPELMRRLATMEHVVGIKQVGAEALTEMTAVGQDLFLTYSAADAVLYGSYGAGAIGAIAAIVTVAPGLCVEQWHAFQDGNHSRAIEIQRVLSPIVHCYSGRPFPGKVKQLINLQGRAVGSPRSPDSLPDKSTIGRMRQVLANAGLQIS